MSTSPRTSNSDDLAWSYGTLKITWGAGWGAAGCIKGTPGCGKGTPGNIIGTLGGLLSVPKGLPVGGKGEGNGGVPPAAYKLHSSLRGKRRSPWVVRHRWLYQRDSRLWQNNSRLYQRDSRLYQMDYRLCQYDFRLYQKDSRSVGREKEPGCGTTGRFQARKIKSVDP